ncbi:phenylacetate--CoA ligase family protein [Telmatospirillum siberiense]|nr:AMP-binding protein [Telmatospirillum siberiense]
MAPPLWNPQMEGLDRKSLRDLQLVKLRALLVRVYEASPYYHEKFRKAGVDPYKFSSWEDYAHYPFFDKEEERLSQEQSLEQLGHPFGLHISCDPRLVNRVSASSGTTGRPTYSGYTEKDRAISLEHHHRFATRIGLRKGDRVLFSMVLAMWAAGVPGVDALLNFGACVIPIGGKSGTEGWAQTAVDTRPEVLMCTPSFALHLIKSVPERTGIDTRSLGIRKICVTGEPGGSIKEIYTRISEGFGGAEVYDGTGATGVHNPTCVSCEEHSGLHFFAEDNAIFEIVDPKTMLPLPLEDGVEGEIVYTGLHKECAPLVRWRDKDIVQVFTAPCACGRPGPRLVFKGRVDDMLLVRGVNVFPNAIRDVISRASDAVTGHVRVVKAKGTPVVNPPVRVKVELKEPLPPEARRVLVSRLESQLHDALHFSPSVELFDTGTLPQELGSTGKSKIVEETD